MGGVDGAARLAEAGSPERHALLIAGHGEGAPALAGDGAHQLARLGEILLATVEGWRLRRLRLDAGQRSAPDRLTLKREIAALCGRRGGSSLLLLVGSVVRTGGEPSLLASAEHTDYPEDTTLPVAWIASQLQRCEAAHLVVVVGLRGDARTAREAAALLVGGVRGGSPHLIAVETVARPAAVVDVVTRALSGAAGDPSTGTVTTTSLRQHLTAALPGVLLSGGGESATLLTPPPVGKLWELGWSRPAAASEAPRATRRTQTDHALTGVVLPGRFQIVEEIARGSFGAVHRARQLAVGRDVAVKVLQADLDTSGEAGRLFIQEIQAVGSIDHPNVVRVYQADVAHDGRLFYAMELLEGRTLQQIADSGVIAVDRAVPLLRQLLAGLGAAHDVGLVHADVKPANSIVVPSRSGERLVLLDFGLARLRATEGGDESAGGTPAFMAPEQLRDGRVDARSDLFSAGLVLVNLLTGWRRRRAADLIPPLDGIDDTKVRAALTRALALDPADRFPTAAEMSAALAGETLTTELSVERPPFRRLAPFTELDGRGFHGRDHDLALLGEHVLFRRHVVVTAPSGTGKTSLLRAGLVPRLENLGLRVVYVSCRLDPEATLIRALDPAAATATAAVANWLARHDSRLVLILDQLESLLIDSEEATDAPLLVRDLLALAITHPSAELCTVLSVREDFLARLLGGGRLRTDGFPTVRLGPLTREGAHAAITRPLADRRLTLDPDLLARLLDDLVAAAAGIAREMGWASGDLVYPPHLQLACSVLYEALPPGHSALTLDQYQRLGGLDAIVGEHLDRVLETEVEPADVPVARDLFLALVTGSQTRAARTETELFDMLPHDRARVVAVLEILRTNGLIVRTRRATGEAFWELVHDSLVPRVHGWLDRRDLARRRAIELVRYHLRRSRPDALSLLSRAELRELDAHRGAVGELDAEWARRLPVRVSEALALSPSALVHRSRWIVRRTRAAAISIAVVVLGGIAAAAIDRRTTAEAARRAQSLIDRDMGRFVIELAPFDWDDAAAAPLVVDGTTLPLLDWTLLAPSAESPEQAGEPLPRSRLKRRGPIRLATRGRLDVVEAPGGAAFLRVTGRGRPGETCAPSLIPIRTLPGYAQRERGLTLVRIAVPTCQASRSGMVSVDGGPFLRGGLGRPRSAFKADFMAPGDARLSTLATYRIDRTEVTNAAFAMFASHVALTGIAQPPYLPTAELRRAADPRSPVAGLPWRQAVAYCAYLGKRLPTSDEWEKALRGGIHIAGAPNPMPDRSYPWGVEAASRGSANLNDEVPRGTRHVASFPRDTSPYGIVDLAGNVMEWTSTSLTSATATPIAGTWAARGGNWEEASSSDLMDFTTFDNPRISDTRDFRIGVRCASSEP